MGLADTKLALVPVDLDGCSVPTFSHPIAHSDSYWCLAAVFLCRSKPNAWHRFVGPMAVDMYGGVPNYPKAQNRRRDSYHYLSLPAGLSAAKAMQLELSLYTKISWFKTWTCNCFHRQKLEGRVWFFYELALSTCYGLCGFLVLANNRKSFLINIYLHILSNHFERLIKEIGECQFCFILILLGLYMYVLMD